MTFTILSGYSNAGGTGTGPGANIYLERPFGLADGDMLFSVGYTEIANGNVAWGANPKVMEANNTGGGIHTLSVLRKTASSEPSAWNIVAGATGSYWIEGASFAVREASSVRQTPAIGRGNTSVTATPAVSLTAVPAGDLLVWICTNYQEPGTVTVPTGYTLVQHSGTIAIATKVQATTGNTGTVTGSWGTAGGQVATLFSLAPQPRLRAGWGIVV